MKILALPRLPLSLGSGRDRIEQLFGKAGVRLNGRRPWDIRVLNDRFYDRVLAEGNLGLGDSYIEGWWECDRVDEFIERLLRAKIYEEVVDWPFLFDAVRSRLLNWQSKAFAFANAGQHYDIGDDVYER